MIKPVLQQRRAAMAAKPASGMTELRRSLGTEGIVDIDPLTRTPRQVARTDGFLTGASNAKPADVALGYLRAHATTFGLASGDIARLSLRKDYTDIAGIHHLSFVQSVGGVAVFGNGLKANVAPNGSLISIQGSPVANLPSSVGAAKLSASAARNAAIEDVFATPKSASAKASGSTTTFSGGDQAKKVVFTTINGPRIAWQTITSPSKSQMYLHVLDAQTGRVLYRRDLVQHDNAKVVDNYIGAPKGGTPHVVNLPTSWLPSGSPRLAGNVAHVYNDVNDDNTAQPGEEVGPSGSHSFVYNVTTFNSSPDCSSAFPCLWDPETPDSWQANAKPSAVQLMYFIGKYHDHLRAAPIGFTRSAGNFEAVDGDAVQGENLDGADTADGLPDGNHLDNANFGTPPDGTPPRMQMYLWHTPGDPTDPFLPTMGSYDGDIVYHEYTHGLSNRLVVDANGVSTLGNLQAGSMGEAWGDWYGTDFLVKQGYLTDTAAAGDLRVGAYVGADQDLIRSQPLDCPVGSTSTKCPGTPDAGAGGYTYGDFGLISGGGPEVHADGEIWAETLWDLRKAISSGKAEGLVTRAMELAPANPSFLDMRNAILQADLVLENGKAHKNIWKVFAKRGMGYFAGANDGDDTQPAEDFNTPPPAGTPTGSLSGTVTDSDSGDPIAGATVAFGGHASGFAGDYAAVTAADGTYEIDGIIAGTYPKVFAVGPGFDRVSQTVSVGSHPNAVDWSLRRDWAASSGGGTIAANNTQDGDPFGCGAAALIDQSQGSGVSTAVEPPNTPTPPGMTPKFATIKLPAAVDIAELQINPTATCGDGGSASTGDYKVETSQDGTTFTVGATGHFGLADRGHMVVVPLTAGTTGVQYVRYTMLGTQVMDSGGTCPGAFSGCDFVDSVEVAVYGVAS